MTRDHVDLRVRRTHMVLREALIDLIEEKGFDAVTVGDIAERAMVNRTTFYRHYADKYALVTGIFEEAVNQMFREIGPLPENLEGLLSSESEFDAKAVQSYIDSQLAAWSAFFEHIARHARLYRVMLGKRGSSWFAVQMRDYFAEAIRQRARTLSASGLRATNDPNAAPGMHKTNTLDLYAQGARTRGALRALGLRGSWIDQCLRSPTPPKGSRMNKNTEATPWLPWREL